MAGQDAKIVKRLQQFGLAAATPAAFVGAVGDFFAPKGGWFVVGVIGVFALALMLLAYLRMQAGKDSFEKSIFHRLVSTDADLNWVWAPESPLKSHGLHMLFIFGAACLLFAGKSAGAAAEGGVLAKHVDAISLAQQQIGISQAILTEQRKTNQILNSIDTKADNFKKESSNDPRKELANRGITWEAKNFSTAVKNQDVETVKLFLEGGMPIRRFEMRDVLLGTDTEIAKLFSIHTAKFPSEECGNVSGMLVSSLANGGKITGNAKDLFASACGNNDAVRKDLSRNLEDAVRSREAHMSSEKQKIERLRFPGYDRCIDWAMRDGGKTLVRESLAKYHTVLNEDNGSYQYSLWFSVGIKAKEKERDGLAYNLNDFKVLVAARCKELGEITVDEQYQKNWISAYRELLTMFN